MPLVTYMDDDISQLVPWLVGGALARWLAGTAEDLPKHGSDVLNYHPGTLSVFTGENTACSLPESPPPRPTTRAVTHRSQPWRPCHSPCRLFWSTRIVCRRSIFSIMSYRVYSTGHSGLVCGNGISVRFPMESVNFCQTSPEPKTTQHLCVAALQTARIWQRGCGLFTMRPKGRLKVWTYSIESIHTFTSSILLGMSVSTAANATISIATLSVRVSL